MTEQQKFVRDLILKMAAAAGADLTGLARKARLAPSTLTRFMNGETKHTPTTTTLYKLSKASGVPFAAGGSSVSRVAKIEAVLAVARGLDVTSEELAAALATDGGGITERLLAWLDIARQLPAAAENHAFLTLRAIIDASGSGQEQAEPRKAASVRRGG